MTTTTAKTPALEEEELTARVYFGTTPSPHGSCVWSRRGGGEGGLGGVWAEDLDGDVAGAGGDCVPRGLNDAPVDEDNEERVE